MTQIALNEQPIYHIRCLDYCTYGNIINFDLKNVTFANVDI